MPLSKTDNALRYLSWWSIFASIGTLVMLSVFPVNFYIPGENFVVMTCLVFGASGAVPFLLAAAVGLFLFWFGAKGVKTHSALKPALIAVPVLADTAFFAYLLFCIITGRQAMWDWQLIPSLVTDAAFAVLLALYYVHIAKEKKKEK